MFSSIEGTFHHSHVNLYKLKYSNDKILNMPFNVVIQYNLFLVFEHAFDH